MKLSLPSFVKYSEACGEWFTLSYNLFYILSKACQIKAYLADGWIWIVIAQKYYRWRHSQGIWIFSVNVKQTIILYFCPEVLTLSQTTELKPYFLTETV